MLQNAQHSKLPLEKKIDLYAKKNTLNPSMENLLYRLPAGGRTSGFSVVQLRAAGWSTNDGFTSWSSCISRCTDMMCVRKVGTRSKRAVCCLLRRLSTPAKQDTTAAREKNFSANPIKCSCSRFQGLCIVVPGRDIDVIHSLGGVQFDFDGWLSMHGKATYVSLQVPPSAISCVPGEFALRTQSPSRQLRPQDSRYTLPLRSIPATSDLYPPNV